MKESVTKFDFEAAFKALDDIDIPAANKVLANRPALTEIFSRKSKFDSLMEEYYDIGSMAELDGAKEAREAEIAKAKLARIEKIVDLDAESPEDLLTSYVGKYIVQCPQCMTLFYKNKEDVVESEEDSSVVNVNEVCQHCGNESGYTLVGKVGEAEPEETELETPEEGVEEEIPLEDIPADEEEVAEEASEEETSEDEDLGDLEAIDLDLDEEPSEDEEEKKEESFIAHEGEALVEEVNDPADDFADIENLADKLEAHNEYIEFLQDAIVQEEKALEKASNEQVKAAIQRRIDAFKADLKDALPDAVKNDVADVEAPEEAEEETEVQEEAKTEETENQEEASVSESLTEALHEEADLEVSASEFEKLINEPEFKKPISDSEVRAMMDSKKEAEKTEENLKLVEEAMTDEEADNYNALRKLFDKTVKTSAEMADFALKAFAKNYDEVVVSDKGFVTVLEKNRMYTKYVVLGSDGKDSEGNRVTKISHDLNIQKFLAETKNKGIKTLIIKKAEKFVDAEKAAKEWSKDKQHGPAFIWMAQADGKSGPFVSEYMNGNIMSDIYSDMTRARYSQAITELAKAGCLPLTPEESLEEGIFDKIKNAASGLKNKVTKFIDNQLKSRASSADWLLKNALVDYSKASVSEDGSVETDKSNQQFTTFIVVGFKDTGKNRQKIKAAVKVDSKNLVTGMEYPEVKAKYADAEKVAKGWSMQDGNGPAFIYLSKDNTGASATFLCKYFQGELDKNSDQLAALIEKVRNNIAGSKLMDQGGADQSDVKNLKASAVKAGMKIKLEDGTIADITEVKQSKLNRKMLSVAITLEDGSVEPMNISADAELVIMRDSIKNESFDAFMTGLEELHEASLEKLISDSLVEAYGNVAGYRLTSCEYLNEKFNVNGTIFFTSGNTRKTTYSFSEALINEGKVELKGLNEKLGLDKQFTLVGRVDENKTLITESFRRK